MSGSTKLGTLLINSSQTFTLSGHQPRMVSLYQIKSVRFISHLNTLMHILMQLFPQPNVIKSLKECVDKSWLECDYRRGAKQVVTLISLFCGSGKICKVIGNTEALQRAKMNVERYYPIIGVLEHFKESLLLYERALPQFFSGVVNVRSILKQIFSKSRAKCIAFSCRFTPELPELGTTLTRLWKRMSTPRQRES